MKRSRTQGINRNMMRMLTLIPSLDKKELTMTLMEISREVSVD